jgi:hypothetical protein
MPYEIEAGYINIDKQLKPLLIKQYENLTAFNPSKCNSLEAKCTLYIRSQFSLIPTLSIIGNISKSAGVLLLNGENDSQTPVQQAFLLQQGRLEVDQYSSMFWQIFILGLRLMQVFHILIPR